MPAVSGVEVGHRLPAEQRAFTQADLIRYAGASGDFNPLHWDPDVAARVSPTKGVIVHGMLTMGHLARVVTRWAGGPDRLLGIEASFRAPCPVGAVVSFGGEVLEVDGAARTATLAIWAELEGGEKLIDRRRSRAVVRLD